MSESNSRTKRQRPANGSPTKCSKKRRDKGTFVCPVCLENIVEGTKIKPGQDAVYCEGICDTWLHRKCAGLPKSIFTNLDKNVPYFCPHCQLHTQETEIVSLKNTIEKLTKTIDELKAKIETPNDASQSADLISLNHSATVINNVHNIPHKEKVTDSSTSQMERKCNIVLSGIKECPKGTPKLDCFKHDLDNVVDVLHTIDNEFQKQNVRDCLRLGKFKENASRPRSILIKFYRSIDALSILSNRNSLPNGIILKPDMNREERDADALLLKECWRLINSGVPKASIKISRFHIYVNKQKHGEIINSAFCLTPQHDNNNSVPNSVSHSTAAPTDVVMDASSSTNTPTS